MSATPLPSSVFGSDLEPNMTHDGAEPDEVKGAASDSQDVAVVRVVVAECETLDDEVSRNGQLNEAKGNDDTQGNCENTMDGIDGIDEDLWQHIKAQLRDAKNPVFVNFVSRYWTVLHRAAARGLAEVVGRLLTACPFLINKQCDNGTALHVAAANGHAAIVTQLLAADPTLAEARTLDGGTALHHAAGQGHAAIVAQLLALNPSLAEARTDDGQTALHYAARGGHTATVTQLLAANPALIDARSTIGLTILHEAAGGGHLAMVTQLLALKPALAEARTDFGCTALHKAAFNGHAAIVAQLLAANPAVINARSYGYTTALHYATGGHATITAQLLAAKASTEATDGYGRTVLHGAVRNGHNEIVSQLLAANPALIDARADDGSTVLHFACHDGMIAQLLAARPSLLDAMINDDDDDVDSETALLNAVELGQEETAIRMLTVHPNLICEALNASCGWTVFHCAAYFAREKVMSWLLSAVSEPELEQVLRRRSTEENLEGEGNMTALELGAMRGHRNIVAQLLTVCPSLIDLLNYKPPYESSFGLCESALDIFLEFKPALFRAVDAKGYTQLHWMMFQQPQHNKELIERVWQMNPDALHAVNCNGKTPFHIAVDKDNDIAIDLFQWNLTFAEIAKVYSHYEKSVERFKPLMQLQCEQLHCKLLPGLVDIVFEYLGFRTVKQQVSREED